MAMKKSGSCSVWGGGRAAPALLGVAGDSYFVRKGGRVAPALFGEAGKQLLLC